MAAVTWIGRSGYRDVDGSSISLLDALYYASVTITTTGYGDITPVSSTARAVTAFLVTPARILFLIVLVGTTIELLTERFRAVYREDRWRKRVRDHVIIVGFGTKGRGALETLIAGGRAEPQDVVAIDTAPEAVADATAAGVVALLGDGTRTSVLKQAKVEGARAVIVTCHRDDTATLVTLTARELNPDAVIAAGVRESENAHLLRQSGASTVIVSSEASGRMLGLATDTPGTVSLLEDLLVAGSGLDLIERPVDPSEVGGAPRSTAETIPVAVVRDGESIPFHDPRFQRLEPVDVVVCLHAQTTPSGRTVARPERSRGGGPLSAVRAPRARRWRCRHAGTRAGTRGPVRGSRRRARRRSADRPPASRGARASPNHSLPRRASVTPSVNSTSRVRRSELVALVPVGGVVEDAEQEIGLADGDRRRATLAQQWEWVARRAHGDGPGPAVAMEVQQHDAAEALGLVVGAAPGSPRGGPPRVIGGAPPRRGS